MREKYLHNGAAIPSIGLGTWQIPISGVVRAVDSALDYGYRHIDCAFECENEVYIGAALKRHFEENGLRRQQIFVTSKLWSTFHQKDRVIENCIRSLHALNLEYLDLYLINWPVSLKPATEVFPLIPSGEPDYDNLRLEDTWTAMEQLVRCGLVRSIGLANFNKKQILRILECCDIPPAVLQVESHPYFLNEDIINFARGSGMQVTAYAAIGSSYLEAKDKGVMHILDDPVVSAIAKVHGKTAAQVLIRFALQRNLIVIPKSFNPEKIKENIEVFDFELSFDEMERLHALNRDERIIDPMGLIVAGSKERYYTDSTRGSDRVRTATEM
ncbi:aldo keto reductase family 1 member B4 [Echinococcus multilocularis]|uniref:Aldo keto reductase family 1 member B4 n=1 Tax=Echinococcus multilocularis TaxID=6211 RepID=A0A068YAK9_ECHMU|nr:aldo keto reductase family 1 member B4 [Echinococcus multilocularis]